MPEFPEPILILSDVHFSHPACLLEHWEELTPLLRQAKTVIFNGDTVEMRYRSSQESARAVAADLKAFCEGLGVHPVFITGNHDPVISAVNHLSLAGGQLLVLHGDVLFEEITPWSREAKVAGPAHRRALEDMGGKHELDLEGRLTAVRRACLEFEKLEARHPPNIFGKITTYLQELWPPTRPFKILKVWGETPEFAARLAEKYAPGCRLIALGHTHRSGVWRRRKCVVVNTGSFTPLSGRLGIWMENGAIRVRKIVHRGEVWTFGRDVHRMEIHPIPSAEPVEAASEPFSASV